MNSPFLRASWFVSFALTARPPTYLRNAARSALGGAVALLAALAFSASAAYAQTDLSVLKYGADTAVPGADVTYNVILLNVGPDPANLIGISDAIPPGMTFVSFTQTQGPALTCTLPSVGAGGSVDCSLASLASGVTVAYNLTLRIDVTTPPGTAFINIATVSTSSSDPDVENDAGVAGTFVLPAATTDLAVRKTALPAVVPNGNLTYTLAVDNFGPAAASTVVLTDNLPSNVTFVSLQQTSGPAFTCATPSVGSTGTVNCSLGSFAVGTAVFVLTVQVPLSAVNGVTNQVSVSGSTFDPNEENNISVTSTRIESTDLTLTNSAPSTAARGGTISYTLTLANAGPDTAQNVVLSDVLPAGTTFASWTQNSGPASSCLLPSVGAVGDVSCLISSLATGVPAQFTLTVNAVTAGSVTSTANSTTETPDLNPSASFAASASATTAVLAPPMIAKGFAPTVIVPGQQSTLTFTLTNPVGNAAALSGVAFTDALPAGLSIVSVTTPTCGGTLTNTAPTAIALSGATLAMAGNCQFSVVVSGDAAGVYASTTGVVSSTNAGVGGTATATLAVAVPLTITQNVSPSTILVGDTTTATFTLSNPNAVALSGVSFANALPSGLVVASGSSPTNTCGGTLTAVAGAGSVTLTGATVGANASCTVSIQLQGATPGTWINAVTVSAVGIGTGNTDRATVTVFIVVPTLQMWALWLLTLLIVATVGGHFRASRQCATVSAPYDGR